MTHPTDPAAIRAALDRLAATVAGMTPGEWSTDPETCCIYATDSGRLLTIRDGCEGTGADLHGAIVLRSAADALIDVARAAEGLVAFQGGGLMGESLWWARGTCLGCGAEAGPPNATGYDHAPDCAALALDAALAALAAAVPGAGDGA